MKNMGRRYRPGARDRARTKIRRRNTTEAIIGAITGTLARPQLLVLGRRDSTGRLRPIGRTVPLRPDAAHTLAEISADTSVDRGGVYRHPIRYVRLRLNATVDDVSRFGGGPAAVAG
ncbi:hypothetical protein [Streptomyces sp. NPDC058412]|uniref:hypothetical protein n=1 Tax=Streptomyces sp. NPDC058412 TaxID=3346486 RepID=UPI0036552BCD